MTVADLPSWLYYRVRPTDELFTEISSEDDIVPVQVNVLSGAIAQSLRPEPDSTSTCS